MEWSQIIQSKNGGLVVLTVETAWTPPFSHRLVPVCHRDLFVMSLLLIWLWPLHITDRRGRLLCLKEEKNPTESLVVFQPLLMLPAPSMNPVTRQSINPVISTVHHSILFFCLFLETGTLPHSHPFSLKHSKISAHKRDGHILTCYQIRKEKCPPVKRCKGQKRKQQSPCLWQS